MKPLIWAVALLDLWFGLRALLNVVGVLHNSKYAKATTALFALLCLGLGLACLWFVAFEERPRLALWLAIGPWAAMIAISVLSMTTGRYP